MRVRVQCRVRSMLEDNKQVRVGFRALRFACVQLAAQRPVRRSVGSLA